MNRATLDVRATQATVLTPRLQQSVRLLQLSSSDLAQEVAHALDGNPFLDDGSATASAAHDDASIGGESASDGTSSPVPSQWPVDRDSGTRTRHDPVRWTSDDDVATWTEAPVTLRMHLHAGLAGYRLEARDRRVAEVVVEAVDDDGYIRQDLAEVVDRMGFEPPVDDAELAIALTLVQQVGPAGIAARSVSECLVLQITQHVHDERVADRRSALLATRIAADHLDLLIARDWNTLRKRLGCTERQVMTAVAVIRALDPHPASGFGGAVAGSIVPDVIVSRARGGWNVELNPAVLPRIGLNRAYAAHVRAAGDQRRVLGDQLQEARWLLHGVAQRFATIERVARAIVAEQGTFFEYGDIGIRPLLLREIAERLDLHESTVSRAVSDKFMATPRGVIAFRHFFSRRLATVTGGDCSSTAIRAAMRELIDGEDRAVPLSDVALARSLVAQGIRVARRTVTKYRVLMHIPAVGERRAAR